VGALAIVLTAASGAATTAAAVPHGLPRMPGEAVLSESQRQAIVQSMRPEERAVVGSRWTRGDVLPVAYERAHFRLDEGDHGNVRPVRVAVSHWSAASGGVQASLATSATSGRHDLTITIAVTRVPCSGCYLWVIDNYAEWRGESGMDAWNRDEDMIGSAWAGGLTLHQDYITGAYAHGESIDIYRSDVVANSGVGWSFHEWSNHAIPQWRAPARFAYGGSYVRQTRWAGRTDNAVMKYFHTGTNGISYSMGFAGLSISSSPSVKWSAAAFASFSH
jgi:hypothetical protein